MNCGEGCLCCSEAVLELGAGVVTRSFGRARSCDQAVCQGCPSLLDDAYLLRLIGLRVEGLSGRGAARVPAFSRFVMIRPVQTTQPRSGEHCFCTGRGTAGSSVTIRT